LPQTHLSLPLTLLIFIFIISSIAMIQYGQSQVMNHLRQDYLFNLRQELNALIAKAKWSYLLAEKQQHIEYLMSTGLNQMNALTYYSIQMLSNSFIILLYIIFSLLIAFKLTLLTLGITYVLFGFLKKQRAAYLGKRYSHAQSMLHAKLSQFLRGVKSAKSHNQTEAYLAHFTYLNVDLTQCQKIFSQNSAKTRSLFLSGSAILFAFIFFIATAYFHTSIFVLLALLFMFTRLLPQFSNAQQAYLQIANVLPIYQELCTLRNALRSQQERFCSPSSISLILQNAIHLHQVSFQYPNQNSYAIFELTCTIPARKITAIVGPSGAGKSTLADLLLGLFVPSRGALFLDQQKLDEHLHFSWRNTISYIPQDPYFFNESIRANLLWAAPEATESEIWESLAQAGVDQVVAKLADGLDTLLGEQACRLSGGERQRIAMARALLRKPSVLLLDEATHALDRHHKAHIHHSLQSLKHTTTIIMISHHRQSVDLADQVLVLKAGQLVESGAPAVLFADPHSALFNLFARDQ
jgi:ABC-type multidrug transport system fused ATPase/permease subunit